MDKPFVLVVDDEKEARETVAEVLLKECEVDTASGGEEALKKLKEQRYHVMILDIRMPGIDGLEVLKRLKKEGYPHRTEVIMLTAFDEAKLAWEAAMRGASDFITKPYRNEDLILRVRFAAKRKMDEDIFSKKASLANAIYGNSRKEEKIYTKRRSLMDALFLKNGQDLHSVSLEDIEAIYSGKWDNIEPEKI